MASGNTRRARPPAYPRGAKTIRPEDVAAAVHQSGGNNGAGSPLSLAVQSMVADATLTQELPVHWRGQEFTIRYRSLGYMGRLRARSEARVLRMTADGKGEGLFLEDAYVRYALKRMIVESPITFSDAFLETMDDDLGDQLAVIVPPPEQGEIDIEEEKKV